MTQPLPPSLEEVQHALEDVRRIRTLLDTSRRSSALRRVFRPVMLFGFFLGPVLALFALFLEWVSHRPGTTLWGLGKAELMWIAGGAWMLVNGVVKMVVFRVSARREGFSLGAFMKRIYRADYLRLLVPLGIFSALLCVVVSRLEAPGMITGILFLTFGLLWVMLPLALPIPESPVLGWFFVVGGALALFVLPSYPFLKAAVLGGLGFGVIMPLGYWATADAVESGEAVGAPRGRAPETAGAEE